MKHWKQIFTIVSLLLVTLTSISVWVYREIRQQTIDQTLILALKSGDDKKAFTALAEGANGEAQEMDRPPSFLKALLYLTRQFRHTASSLTDPPKDAHQPALLVLYHTHYRVNQRKESGPDPALVKALLEHGAQANDLDDCYTSPMWYSCFSNSDAVSFLLAKGANVNSSDCKGITALMNAVMDGRFDVAVALLEHGANISIKEDHGQTAIDFVREDTTKLGSPSVSPNIAALLRRYGAT